MTRQHIFQLAACLAAFVLSTSLAFAQPAAKPQKQDKNEEMILKVYRVADLFTPRPDYPYRSGLPTTEAQNPPSAATLGGLGGGGLGGGGSMGGGGGGFFQVPDPLPRVAQLEGNGGGGLGGMGGLSTGLTPASREETLRFTRDDLIQAITSTIMPDNWEGVGGQAVCTPLGGLLLIKQTTEAHTLIEKLLSDIRTEGGTSRTVTVDALWLSLTSEDFEKIVPKQNGQAGELSALEPEVLKELANKNPSHQGRLSCYNDQTVHLVSGNRRTVMVNVIPTVGFGALGYTPQVAFPNVGLLLQVRPTVDPDRKTAVLNVTSTITQWQEPAEPFKITTNFAPGEREGVVTKGGSTEVTIDRVNLNTQHLGTTVRMPVGKPVLIGGLSRLGTDIQAKTEPDDKGRQLYLIIKITVNETPNPPVAK